MSIKLKKVVSIFSAVIIASTISIPTLADNFKGKKTLNWAASFAFSPQGNQIYREPFVINKLENQTVRSIVHLSLGGEKIRIRISNAFGDKPLTIDAASVGVRDTESSIVVGTLKTLTFDGESSIIIPVGADIYTDPVEISVEDDSDLAINLYIAGESPLPTIDDVSNKTSFISMSGDATTSEEMPAFTTVDVSYFTSGVDVLAHRKTITVVATGTSLTDGFGADLDGANNFPSVLARRLKAKKSTKNSSVVNTAISGGRLLADTSTFGQGGLAGFERNVLNQSNITHVIVEYGTNDIGFPEVAGFLPAGNSYEPVTSDQLIAGMKQLVIKAHNRGIKIIAATLPPYKGSFYYTDKGEAKRQAFNHWIRTTNVLDGVIDFDVILRDPKDPLSMNPLLQLGDNLHPNVNGYQAMAESVDLKLFKRK